MDAWISTNDSDVMLHTGSVSAIQSDNLLETLSPYEQFLIVTHDNPDPDAIATGWAVQFLIHEKLHRTARLVGGGAIIRAENKHMVELLHPPIELVNRFEMDGASAAILVDCGLGTTNQLLTRADVHPVAVIDHHLTPTRNSVCPASIPFRDIRPAVAACATIAASYLREQNLEPGFKLATAMLYAIRTETQGCETHYSRLDRSVLCWLTERAEPSLLAEIESAPLSREYFADMVLALQNTYLYDDIGLCLLPQASGGEIVGEVADLLIRCQGLRRVLCGAVVGDDLLLSARTERDAGNAAFLLQATLEDLGTGGGHVHRAGGKISGVARKGRIAADLEDDIRRRWLAACGVRRQRGTRLVARRDIIEHL